MNMYQVKRWTPLVVAVLLAVLMGVREGSDSASGTGFGESFKNLLTDIPTLLTAMGIVSLATVVFQRAGAHTGWTLLPGTVCLLLASPSISQSHWGSAVALGVILASAVAFARGSRGGGGRSGGGRSGGGNRGRHR